MLNTNLINLILPFDTFFSFVIHFEDNRINSILIIGLKWIILINAKFVMRFTMMMIIVINHIAFSLAVILSGIIIIQIFFRL